MKIAINCRFLIPDKLEGMGVFTLEVVRRLVDWYPEHAFVLYFDRHPPDYFTDKENVTSRVLRPAARHPVLWYLWFEFALPGQLQRDQPDVFVSMDGFLTLRPMVPRLPVIHDIAFEHYPKDVPKLARWYYRFFFPKYARAGTRVATVSEFSKQDIARRYNIAPDRIDVVYNGAGDRFVPLPEAQQKEIRKELTGGVPYFIYVGALHKRKNIDRLLEAFDRFKKRSGRPHKLVLAGRKAWKTQEMERAYEAMQYREDVVFTGRLSDEQLAAYLASAEALTYVSYFEGFGIPVLEAMQCEVPVLTSDSTSLPEVAGDAALLVDPTNRNAIASGMEQLASNVTLRKSLIEKGRIQRRKFSWDKTARALWHSIEQCVGR